MGDSRHSESSGIDLARFLWFMVFGVLTAIFAVGIMITLRPKRDQKTVVIDIEQQRIAQSQESQRKKADEARLAKQNQLTEGRRLAEQNRLAEERRLAEQMRFDAARLTEIAQKLEEREKQRIQAEQESKRALEGIAQLQKDEVDARYRLFAEKRDRWLSKEEAADASFLSKYLSLMRELTSLDEKVSAPPLYDSKPKTRNGMRVYQSIQQELTMARIRMSVIRREVKELKADYVQKRQALSDDVHILLLQEEGSGSEYSAFWHAYDSYLQVKCQSLEWFSAADSVGESEELTALETARDACRKELQLLYRSDLESRSLSEILPRIKNQY